MKYWLGLVLCCVMLCSFMSPCYASVTVRDDDGNTITLNQPAQRIVSLSPSETEMIFAAGGGNHLVGVVRYSYYPEAAKKIPVVGDAQMLDVEKLLSLQPDVVVVWRSGTPAAQVEQLKRLGIPLYFGQPKRLHDIPNDLETLGVLMGTSDVAKPAAQVLRQRLSQLQENYSKKPSVRVFYQIWEQPIYTLSAQHIVNDAITMCGGVNIFAELKTTSPTVDKEAVINADPEAIIGSGGDADQKSGIYMWTRFPQMMAVKRNNLFLLDDDLINRAGPRMVDGATAMCEKIDQARHKRP